MVMPARKRIVIAGTLPGGEVWSSGWYNVASGTPDTSTLQQMAQKVADYLSGLSVGSALRSCLSAGSFITSVSVYQYAAGDGPAIGKGLSALNLAGGGSTSMPNQVAIVATTITGVPTRRTRGRLFWPANGVATSAGGQLSSPTPAALATNMATLLKSASTLDQPAVVSKTAASAELITAVRVDSRLDIIRARAERQAATSNSTAIL